MPKLIQYRCCKCQSLMFKYRIGDEKLEVVGRNANFVDCPDGKKDVVCNKCCTRQRIEKDGLVKVEIKDR